MIKALCIDHVYYIGIISTTLSEAIKSDENKEKSYELLLCHSEVCVERCSCGMDLKQQGDGVDGKTCV